MRNKSPMLALAVSAFIFTISFAGNCSSPTEPERPKENPVYTASITVPEDWDGTGFVLLTAVISPALQVSTNQVNWSISEGGVIRKERDPLTATAGASFGTKTVTVEIATPSGMVIAQKTMTWSSI